MQGQKLDVKHAKLKYSGMVDCLMKIVTQEGFKALYWVRKLNKSPS